MMITPPINCRSMENDGFRNSTNARAPNLTTSDTIFATIVSCFGVASGLKYSL